MRVPTILCLFLFLSSLEAQSNLFRYPDVSNDHIVFTCENDLWIVAKEGGQAYRLSVPSGGEQFAKFSPDGQMVAFTGNYDGLWDVYTIPVKGGIPNQLTFHSSYDRFLDWHPNGDKLLFASSRASGKQRFSQFWEVGTDGGLPIKLPIEHGEFASYSPDGSQLALTQKTRVFRTWKRYKGGSAADIHVYNMGDQSAENITTHVANDELPMWHGEDIYYLSDRGAEDRMNIWKYYSKTKKHVQITKFQHHDVHFPSIGKDEIVFGLEGDIYILDLNTHDYHKVDIKVVSDFQGVKPRTVNVEKYMRSISFAPSGERVLVEARGEIFSLPTKEGVTKNLTNSSGSAERFPAWSPDGRYMAWWSDASGEYQLVVHDREKGTTTTKTNFKKGYRYSLFWSPDSEKLVFIDEMMQIWMWKMGGEPKIIDVAHYKFHWALNFLNFSWSPDSRYVAYWRSSPEDANSAIYIYDSEQMVVRKVTSSFYNAYMPVFDPEGKYIYYISNNAFDPVYSHFDNTWIYPNSARIMGMSLTNDGGLPVSWKNDTVAIVNEDIEEDEDKKGKKGKKDKKKKKGDDDDDDKKDGDKETKIDFDNMEERSFELPIKIKNVRSLAALKGKLIYGERGLSGDRDNRGSIKMFDFEKKESKEVVKGTTWFSVNKKGDKLLVWSKQKMYVIDAKPGQKLEKALPLKDMNMRLQPKEEWKQLLVDAWRLQRDYFYDKDMHGVDWEAQKAKYLKLLEKAGNRSDVNYVIGEMIGELNASHTYRGGGDYNEPRKREATGFLGIDWKEEDGWFKVDKIIKGAPWDTEVQSPLLNTGGKVQEGDYILAVNGRYLKDYKNPYEAFVGLAKEVVELEVNTTKSYKGSKKVLVKTLSSEWRLRNLAWIEKNRKYVEEKTNGRVGYVYVPSTGWDGQKELARMFYGQFKKPGLIIDERFNNGGQIPDRFVELLERKPLSYYHTRNGSDWQWPPVAHFGAKVMLITGWSGSGGDAFPTYFKVRGLGPLVGTRTWGGLIGLTGTPGLIDNGGVTVPTFRMYDLDGKWFEEGIGVYPDYEVPEDVSALSKGIDKQLDKAIELALKALDNPEFVKPEVPAKEKR